MWLRIGLTSFGGPVAQIDLMHRELVERRGWVDERAFLHALRLCNALPGPEAQQLACWLGWRTGGVRGALAAGGLFILPGLFLILLLAWAYAAWGETAVMTGAVRALGGAVIALVLLAGLRIGRRVVRTRWALALGVAAGAAMLGGVPFPVVVVAGILLGAAIGRLRPTALVPLEDQEDPGAQGATADRGALLRRALVGGGLWVGAIGALLAIGGVAAELAGFFTVTALVTFGGAYAVLPFVATAAVSRFGWLSAEQMVAGLALGETTPGPLVLVNAFVGFMAGWATLGGLPGGVAGGLVAAFATFAPSFLLITVGAPLVERVPRRGPVADALAALQGVVAGAVAVLVVYLVSAALLPTGRIDLLAAAVAVAVLALRRFELPVPALGGAAALVGTLVGVADPGFLLVSR
ncbi:MAG: chromate efflux transporter [Gaiellales bacterium]